MPLRRVSCSAIVSVSTDSDESLIREVPDVWINARCVVPSNIFGQNEQENDGYRTVVRYVTTANSRRLSKRKTKLSRSARFGRGSRDLQ